MNLPYIDGIWRVRGSLPIDPAQSPTDTFKKLDPLFQTNGTNRMIDGDTLTYSNKNPAAQDKMATFTRGTLRVVEGGSKLAYDLVSPALLLCFLAPLLFLGFAQLTITLGDIEKAAAEKSGESSDKAKAAEKEEAEKPLNPIDIALGAPAPEKPKDKEANKDKDKDSKHSPTPAYVFAALFAVLYVAGRILEPWLVRKTFRNRLAGIDDAAPAAGTATQQLG